MKALSRTILPLVEQTLKRGKSILLLGPRQTGKTTLVNQFLKVDFALSFAKPSIRLRYEKDVVQLERDLQFQIDNHPGKKPLIFIDEIQKIPASLDIIQTFIDETCAQFILSGSSARKLKHGANINLLPGRVVHITLDALSYNEIPSQKRDLDRLLTHGSLPNIILNESKKLQENDLLDYVNLYLEDEIRREAHVRNIGAFSKFLEIAAIESGNLINFTNLSQDVGVASVTIKEYFQLLEDCLIAFKIPPLTLNAGRRRLSKAPKYLFFDLGVRRLAANEGAQVSIKQKGSWFEQYVGIEIIREIHLKKLNYTLYHWRDTQGVEIDYILSTGDQYFPIEVKWSEKPREKDCRHLIKFINEYANCLQGYIICRTPTPYKIGDNIHVLPWQLINSLQPFP